MRRRENTFKKYLFSVMGRSWHAQSHEDALSEGIPDLSYGIDGVNGWIELKQIDNFPVRPETKMKPKKYTVEQVNWLVKRGKKGGKCFVMVKIGNYDYYIFNWNKAHMVREGMTQEEYKKECIKHWHKQVEHAYLRMVLTSPDALWRSQPEP